MNGEQAKAMLQFYLGMIDNEFRATRKVIAAVPQDKCDWCPDSKARTARDLAWHITTSEVWFLEGIINGGFGMGDAEPTAPKTIDEILSTYDRTFNESLGKLKLLSGEQLAKQLPFFGMSEMPAVAYLNFLFLHSAHHRGQLSVYLRPMGSKVPSIYGGSADEPFQMAAQS